MHFHKFYTRCLAAILTLGLAAASPAFSASPSGAAWQRPSAGEVRAKALAWLAASKADAATRAKAESLWAHVADDAEEDELLARLVETFASADPNAGQLVAWCARPWDRSPPAEPDWLREKDDPLRVDNLRLYYARRLVHHRLFDEARGQIADLGPADVVAPAALLFYQGVVHRALLEKDEGLNALDRLLQSESSSPKRYVALARLMHQDLEDLKDGSLDRVARRMEDVQRRLDLGRAGPKVRDAQNDIIQTLDEMIKKKEEQRQQQSGAGRARSLAPSNPAQRSGIMLGKGPGEVEKKRIGAGVGWGDLPPKEREEALQDAARDLPSHYRDVIEQYFRRLAAERGENRP